MLSLEYKKFNHKVSGAIEVLDSKLTTFDTRYPHAPRNEYEISINHWENNPTVRNFYAGGKAVSFRIRVQSTNIGFTDLGTYEGFGMRGCTADTIDEAKGLIAKRIAEFDARYWLLKMYTFPWG
jgi:hypothetical protein